MSIGCAGMRMRMMVGSDRGQRDGANHRGHCRFMARVGRSSSRMMVVEGADVGDGLVGR
jgi:hypothetical protein